MSSKRNPEARTDFKTPERLLEVVQRFAPIAFDPATTRDNPTQANFIRTADCDPDGLETKWWEFPGLHFVNPPYCKEWYDKIYSELNDFTWNGELIALVPAKPGTVWFQNLVGVCNRVCFIRGRLTFAGETEPAPFENALLYRGERSTRFGLHFQDLGWVVKARLR